jgi:hypothetical protein
MFIAPLDLLARPSTTVTAGTLERPHRGLSASTRHRNSAWKDTMQARSAFRGRKNGRRYQTVGVLQSGYVSRWLLVPRLGVLEIDQANVRDAENGPGMFIRNVRK